MDVEKMQYIVLWAYTEIVKPKSKSKVTSLKSQGFGPILNSQVLNLKSLDFG